AAHVAGARERRGGARWPETAGRNRVRRGRAWRARVPTGGVQRFSPRRSTPKKETTTLRRSGGTRSRLRGSRQARGPQTWVVKHGKSIAEGVRRRKATCATVCIAKFVILRSDTTLLRGGCGSGLPLASRLRRPPI